MRGCGWISPVVTGHLRPKLVPNFADLSKHCSENTIPKSCGDTEISVRKPVMVEMMLQQGSREKRRFMMNAIVGKQIKGVGDEASRQNRASRRHVGDDEGDPYLPEDLVDGVFRMCVVNAARPQPNRRMVMDGLKVEVASNTIATAVAKISSPK
jgi:hypothetical protein